GRAGGGPRGRGIRDRARRRKGWRRLVPPWPHVARVGTESELEAREAGARLTPHPGGDTLPRDERRRDVFALSTSKRPLARRVLLPRPLGGVGLPNALARGAPGCRVARAHGSRSRRLSSVSSTRHGSSVSTRRRASAAAKPGKAPAVSASSIARSRPIRTASSAWARVIPCSEAN